MLSKLRLTALVLTLPLTACSLRVGEQVDSHKVTVGDQGCLSGAGVTLDQYFNGQLPEKELTKFWGCLDKALRMFAENTQGRDKDQFTASELSSFLSRYFLKGRTISPALMDEALLLKQGMLGGAPNRISRPELQQVLKILRVTNRVSHRLRAHMPITAESLLARGAGADQFELALKDLEEGLAEIGEVMKVSQGSYSFDRLAALLTQMRHFIYPTAAAGDSWLDSAVRWTIALRPAKAIFVSPPRDEIRQDDWSRIYFLAPRYYGLYLRSQFYLRSEASYFHGAGLRRLMRLSKDTIDLLDNALAQRPDGIVSENEMDEFLTALIDSGMIKCQPETARLFLRALFGRVLGTEEKAVLSKATLQHLRDNLAFGTEGLLGLEAFYRERLGEDAFKKSLAKAEIARMPVDQLLADTMLKNDLSREALRALVDSSQEVRTVFPNASGSVFVPQGAEHTTLSYHHMAKVHLLRTVNRLVLNAYGSGKSLTSEQIGKVVGDFFPLLQDLGLVNSQLRSELTKRLFEASLFLYSSDGDQGLTMHEAIEIESLLLSTITRASKLHGEISARCSATKTDTKGNELVPAACYRARFLDRIATYWAYIPGLADYAEKLPKREQEELFGRLEKFLRKGKIEQDFSLSDSQAFVLLPYYVELLFSRFDRNRDGFLDNAEAEAAFPVFQPFLAEKAKEFNLNSAEDHRAVFLYLLSYQDIPADLSGKLTFGFHRYLKDAKVKIHRGQVIRIFEKLLSL